MWADPPGDPRHVVLVERHDGGFTMVDPVAPVDRLVAFDPRGEAEQLPPVLRVPLRLVRGNGGVLRSMAVPESLDPNRLRLLSARVPNPNHLLSAQVPVLVRWGRYVEPREPDGDCWFDSVIRAAQDLRDQPDQPDQPAIIAELAGMNARGLRDRLAAILDDEENVQARHVWERLEELFPEDYQSFRTELAGEGWANPAFDAFLALAPALLDIRLRVVGDTGRETSWGPAGAPTLYLVHTINHYMPALRSPQVAGLPADTGVWRAGDRTRVVWLGTDGHYHTFDPQDGTVGRIPQGDFERWVGIRTDRSHRCSAGPGG